MPEVAPIPGVTGGLSVYSFMFPDRKFSTDISLITGAPESDLESIIPEIPVYTCELSSKDPLNEIQSVLSAESIGTAIHRSLPTIFELYIIGGVYSSSAENTFRSQALMASDDLSSTPYCVFTLPSSFASGFAFPSLSIGQESKNKTPGASVNFSIFPPARCDGFVVSGKNRLYTEREDIRLSAL